MGWIDLTYFEDMALYDRISVDLVIPQSVANGVFDIDLQCHALASGRFPRLYFAMLFCFAVPRFSDHDSGRSMTLYYYATSYLIRL